MDVGRSAVMDGSKLVGYAGPIDRNATWAGSGRWSLKQMLIAAGALLSIAAAAGYGNYYWRTGRFLVSTDDAYVQAHSVLISPRVSGYLSEAPVDDNQPVKAGEVLARIDPRDYQTALAAARANVDAAQAGIDNLQDRITQQRLAIVEAQAAVTTDQAALAFSQQQYGRYSSLAHTGAAKLHQAELNVSYTTIVAPVDGTVGHRTLRVGQYVQAGTRLMAVVPLQAVYITANYKETQLTDVRPGQPVTIDVDTFPGTTVHGHVDSLAPASGQEFALLPPDNATGNFTKILQRIPVKIVVDANDPLANSLRPGMSVEPTIDTKPATSAPNLASAS